jgi:hypothetical protein
MLSETEGVKGFLSNNPFIHQDTKGLNGAVFVASDATFTKEDLARLYRTHFLKGMSKLVIYRFGEADTGGVRLAPREFSDKIKICSAEAVFPPVRQEE